MDIYKDGILSNIPLEVLIEIFSLLERSSILRMYCLNTRLRNLIDEDSRFWSAGKIGLHVNKIRTEWLKTPGIESIWDPESIKPSKIDAEPRVSGRRRTKRDQIIERHRETKRTEKIKRNRGAKKDQGIEWL